MLSVVTRYPECCKLAHYAECGYTECHYAKCRYAECRYAECRYAECRYAECCYAERRCAACHGPLDMFWVVQSTSLFNHKNCCHENCIK